MIENGINIAAETELSSILWRYIQMNHIVREPDNTKWTISLCNLIGSNPYNSNQFGRDVFITPIDDNRGNVGYVIKIDGSSDFILVSKNLRRVSRMIITYWHGCQYVITCADILDLVEKAKRKVFWNDTIEFIKQNVKGEKKLSTHVEMTNVDYAERKQWAENGYHWCYECERKLPEANFIKNEHGRFGVNPVCKSCNENK